MGPGLSAFSDGNVCIFIALHCWQSFCYDHSFVKLACSISRAYCGRCSARGFEVGVVPPTLFVVTVTPSLALSLFHRSLSRLSQETCCSRLYCCPSVAAASFRSLFSKQGQVLRGRSLPAV